MQNNRKLKAVLSAVALLLFLSILVPFVFMKNPNGDIPTTEDVIESAALVEETSVPVTDSEELTVTFIDVRQGDSTLIQCGDKLMLIDAGESGNEDKILNLIHKSGFDKIDLLIATHPHSDHIGSMPAILKRIKVDTVIMPYISEASMPTTRIYEKSLQALSESGAKVERAVPGKEYSLNNLKITILAPFTDTAELNNLSVVLRADFKESSFLFTGDAEKKAEQSILKNNMNVRAAVLKVGHHGSRSSTTEEFLSKVSPQYAVISCGLKNSYGHPSKDTIGRLEKHNIKYYRTDYNGNITVITDGKTLEFKTER